MYRKEDEEDLRSEIYQLKKQLSKHSSENHLLKVKVRKLQAEVTKKDKEMISVLDPRNSPTFARKILYERSATFILSLKEKNDELLDLLQAKDTYIKRLHSQLETTKLYSQSTRKWPPSAKASLASSSSGNLKQPKAGQAWAGLREAESTLVQELYAPPKQRGELSPESDLDRIELACETPHEEIQQLHHHFVDMLAEVDFLKSTIAKLQTNQAKTDTVLRKKDASYTKLAKEVKHLKRPMAKKRSEVFTRLYSGRSCAKFDKIEEQHKNAGVKVRLVRKGGKRDAEVQTGDEEEAVSTICVFIENGSDKERDEYDDEKFDEEKIETQKNEDD